MKKKILFVTWSLTQGGGEAKSVSNILNNINLDKYDVYVFEFCRGLKKINLKESIKFLEPIVNYERENTINERMKLNYYLKNPDRIKEKITDNYDCVIACNRGTTSFISSYIDSYKKIMWIRGSIENLNVNNYESENEKNIVAIQYQKQDVCFDKYDHIVLVSDSLFESFRSLFSRHLNKVVKIYNNVNKEEIIDKSKQEDFDIGVTSKNIIVNVGRLKMVKNQILLVRAMKEVVNCIKDAVLVIIGEGPLEEVLKKEIKDNYLEDNVKIIGYYDNPFPIVKKAKIFCLSSLSEGFCLSISEASVLGLPFVSTDVGGAQELLRSYKCGFIVDNNPSSFADKIITILRDENLYNKLHENAIKASNRFNVKQLAYEVESLIDREVMKNG